MKAASLSDIKKELSEISPAELKALCLRLAKHKKENKELLHYLLFEARDENAFVESAKEEIDMFFNEMNKSHAYYAKKTLRKALRLINRYSKFSGQKQTEVELLVYFCRKMKESDLSIRRNATLNSIYQKQLEKIASGLQKMHEDLRFDYSDEVEELKKI